MTDLRQAWDAPSRPRPIIIIGAGGVVRTAHLPAYQRLRLPVAGLFAAGNVSASLFGDCYPGGGTSLAAAVVRAYAIGAALAS